MTIAERLCDAMISLVGVIREFTASLSRCFVHLEGRRRLSYSFEQLSRIANRSPCRFASSSATVTFVMRPLLDLNFVEGTMSGCDARKFLVMCWKCWNWPHRSRIDLSVYKKLW